MTSLEGSIWKLKDEIKKLSGLIVRQVCKFGKLRGEVLSALVGEQNTDVEPCIGDIGKFVEQDVNKEDDFSNSSVGENNYTDELAEGDVDGVQEASGGNVMECSVERAGKRKHPKGNDNGDKVGILTLKMQW